MWQVVNVIEADPQQLLGVLLQARSLREFGGDCRHAIVVLERQPGSAVRIVELAQRLGLSTALAAPLHENPFLNRWALWQGFPSLRDAPRLALWDWDMVCVAPLAWPTVDSSLVAARRNPVDMYRHHTLKQGTAFPPGIVDSSGNVLSSINGGVLHGAGTELARLADRHFHWYDALQSRTPHAATWELEQLALSLAVGEVGWQRLADPWNVTATSPVADEDVVVWHYNDGHAQTHRLKRGLTSPSVVRESLASLAERWPKTVACFSSFYQEIIGLPDFPLRGDEHHA